MKSFKKFVAEDKSLERALASDAQKPKKKPTLPKAPWDKKDEAMSPETKAKEAKRAGVGGDRETFRDRQKRLGKPQTEAKDTHCSDKCCGSDVKAEDCNCSPDCPHCNCNAEVNEETQLNEITQRIVFDNSKKATAAEKAGKKLGLRVDSGAEGGKIFYVAVTGKYADTMKWMKLIENVNETFDPKHPAVVKARKAHKAGTWNGNVDKNGNAIVHIKGKPHTVTNSDPASRNEDFEPHMMYDPKTGKGYKADKEDQHLKMKKMGYTHEKPEVKESEQLDELSPATLKSYKKKAIKQYKQSANKRNPGGGDYGSATKAAQDKHQKRFDKRHKGIGSEIKRTTDSDIHLKDPKGLVRKDPKANSLTGKPAPYKHKAESVDEDTINNLTAAYINEHNITMAELEAMSPEQLDEIIGKAVGGAFKMGAKAVVGAGRLAKKAVVNKQGNARMSAAGRADSAEKKAANQEKKNRDRERIKAAQERLRKAKESARKKPGEDKK